MRSQKYKYNVKSLAQGLAHSVVPPCRQEVEELDICPALATPSPLTSLGWPRGAGSPSQRLLPQEVLPQSFLEPVNAVVGFPAPRLEPFPPCLSALLIGP